MESARKSFLRKSDAPLNPDGIHTHAATDAPDGWDDFLKAHGGTIYQSMAYARYVRAIGMNPRFIRCTTDGQTKAQLMVVESSRPFQLLYDQPLAGFTLPLARRFLAEDRAVYGPAYSDVAAGRDAVKEAVRCARQQHARFWMSSSPVQSDATVFEGAGLASKPWATFLVDLGQPLEALWQNVDKAARKLVNRTREDGVTIREAQSDADLKAYLDVMNEGRKRNGVRPYDLRGTRAFFEHFVRCGLGRVLLAEKEGRALATLGITHFNGYINEWGAGQSDYALQNKIYASDLIKWHVIEWGQKSGMRYYDLTGVNPEPATPKEQGIFRYKEKWGGVLKNYSEYQSWTDKRST